MPPASITEVADSRPRLSDCDVRYDVPRRGNPESLGDDDPAAQTRRDGAGPETGPVRQRPKTPRRRTPEGCRTRPATEAGRGAAAVAARRFTALARVPLVATIPVTV